MQAVAAPKAFGAAFWRKSLNAGCFEALIAKQAIKQTRGTGGFSPGLRQRAKSLIRHEMFSHIVIFWTDPAQTNAAEEVVASAKKYLATVPGVMSFHAGKMAHSHRGVVDQSYQVGLNLQFETKQAQDEYQDHPLHLAFVEKCKMLWTKVIVYDFE
jgi:hypothetical protein